MANHTTGAQRRNARYDRIWAEAIEAKATVKTRLEADVTTASAVLKLFPRGAMGLTPNHIKFSPEYVTAKQAYNEAFTRLRRYNAAQNLG